MTRLATYSVDGEAFYGAVTEEGMVALSPLFPQWPSLYDALREGGLPELVAAAAGKPVTHTGFAYEMVLPNAPRILCVGVNFPDRNAEYRDGSSQPKYMSLFPRFASGFTGHDRPLIRPPENHTLDYEGEVAIVIGKAGRRIRAEDAYDHICALTLCNEGTIRDWVRHAKFNVTQGKNWDRSGALGPWLVPFERPEQLDEARLVTRVNGEVRQDDWLKRMTFPDPRGDRLYLDLHDAAAGRHHRHRHADRRRRPVRSAQIPEARRHRRDRGRGHRPVEERRGGRTMPLTETDIATAAADLVTAERTRRQIGLLTRRHPDLDMDGAYAIQKAFAAARLASGCKVIGWKIGLTSKAMQDALKIDIPDSGVLFDDMLFENGATVPAGRFIQPRIEAEIAFVMKAPLGGGDCQPGGRPGGNRPRLPEPGNPRHPHPAHRPAER